MAHEDSLLGSFARKTVRSLVGFYYPNIEISNRERIPARGPVLLVANHPNSLKDAVVLGITARRPVRFLAKAPLFEVPVFGPVMHALGMLPAYRREDDPSKVGRNMDTLADAAGILTEGDVLGIFPEGKTHDAPKVEMVKSGASRIAMQAVEKGTKGLKVVPIGLSYEEKERFRSAVWVRVGEPIDVDSWVAEHDNDPKRATRPLTKEIDKRLKELAVHLDEKEWEPYLDNLEMFLSPKLEKSRDPVKAIRQRKRIADAMNHYMAADKEKSDATASQLTAFADKAKEHGVPLDSPILRLRGLRLFMRMLWDPFWMALTFATAVAGTVHHILPFLLVRAIAPRVQTPGRTTVSLTRLALGIPLYGAAYVAVWWWMANYFRPWIAWVWLIPMPLAGIWALYYWRFARSASGMWWQQIRLFFRPAALRELRESHNALSDRLQKTVEEYRRQHPDTSEQKPEKERSRVWSYLGIGALGLTGAAMLLVVISAWRRPTITSQLGAGPNLALLSKENLAKRLDGDERALVGVLRGIDALEKRATALREEFAEGKRSYYNQADNDAVRRVLQEYIAFRAALLRTIWFYQKTEDIADEKLKLRAFLTGYTAAAALFEASAKFVTSFNRSEETVRKLNEPEPLWDIPEGVYDMLLKSITHPGNRQQITEAYLRYQHLQPDFKTHGLVDSDPHRAFHAAIQRSLESTVELSGSLWTKRLEIALDDTKDLGKRAVYRAQSMISTWIGDTKVRQPREGQALIDHEALEMLAAKLKPGDILLERRNWFLSNAFLPGYWPHAALYVGTPEELKELGLDKDPLIAKHWEEFSNPDVEGHKHVIVEALSEGIVFASLEHSIGGGDAVAVLRPNLPQEKINAGIAKAFSHAGKPYDFEFDFFSTDKIVCTELVYRAYDGDITFPLVDIMGRKTMPAIELVRKFKQERGSPDAQMKFIAFIDGDERTDSCRECSEDEFIETLKRPGMTWLQGVVEKDD